MTAIEEVYDFILPEMKSLGIPDTPESRLVVIDMIREAWEKDEDLDNPDKRFYLMVMRLEVLRLRMIIRKR